MKYFEVDDTIEFRVGAPGIGDLVEQARIVERINETSVRVIRGINGTRLEIPTVLRLSV